MPKELSISKHNHLIEACYKLTLNEQRLILSCIAQLNPKKPLPRNNLFTITAKQYSHYFNIQEKHAYTALEEAAQTLYERDIKTYDNRHNERFRWVYYIAYHKKDGKVSMGFSPLVSGYLTLLQKQFTSYKLKQISKLRSIYSIRLFEMLMRFKNTGRFIISIAKFKEILEINTQYKRLYDLKKWVIQPAIDELNQKSNLMIKWKLSKKNREITFLEFFFQEVE